MIITRKLLKSIVPEEKRQLDFNEAYMIITKNYCNKLTSFGACPMKCELCRENLLDIFTLGEAKRKEALLTWRTRNKAAEVRSSHFEKKDEGEQADWIDEWLAEEQNPFDKYLQKLNELDEE